MKKPYQIAAERIRNGEPAGLVIHQTAQTFGLSTASLSKQIREASPARKKKAYQSTVPAWQKRINEN